MDKSLVEKYRKEMLEKYVGISSTEAAPAAAMNVKPTETEEKLIKDMIAETIQAEYGQTPQEFCGQFQKREQTMG